MAKKKGKMLYNVQQSLLNRLAEYESTLEKRMYDYFSSEATKLDKEIASFYQKYGKDNVIRYRDLMKKLSSDEQKMLMRDVDAFVKKYPEYADLLPVRKNIYKLNRLEGLQASVNVQLLNNGVFENEQIENHLKQFGKEAYEQTSKLFGYEYNPEIVKKFVDNKLSTNVISNTINNSKKLANYLSTDIAQAIARGDSYKSISKNLQTRFKNVSKRDFDRLVYTQGTLVFNEATAGVVEDDFQEYEISTAEDSKVCPVCRGLTGEKFLFKDRKIGVNFPPLHPWCRCSFTVVINDRDKWIDDYIDKHNSNEETAENLLDLVEEPKEDTKKNSERPVVTRQIKGVSKNATARCEWLMSTLNVSKDEADEMLKAIASYTEEGDVYAKVHNGDKSVAKEINVLDKMIKNPNMPIFDGNIFRGVHVDDSDGLSAVEKIQLILETGTWKEPGITSFSSDRAKASNFAKGGAHGDKTKGLNVLIINRGNKTGVPIQHLSTQSRPEGEVLIPSDIADRGYKVLKYKFKDKHEEWLGRTFNSKWCIVEVEENL